MFCPLLLQKPIALGGGSAPCSLPLCSSLPTILKIALSSYLKQVPDAIKSQYQFPPPLIAPAAIRDGELICNGIPEESQTHLLNSEHLATQAEQQEVSESRPSPVFLLCHQGPNVCHSCLYPISTLAPKS